MGDFLESRKVRAAFAVVAITLLFTAGALAWRLAVSPPIAESIAAEAARARGGPPAAAPDAAAAGNAPARGAALTVFVSGEVAHPGVYRLPRGARIADAIDAAGGLLPDADPSRLPNLAGRLSDGKQVKVARLGRSQAAGRGAAAFTRLDINVASVEELLTVPGMDAATARAIIDEREGYGPYRSLAELHSILGLDSQVVADLRPFLKVGVP